MQEFKTIENFIMKYGGTKYRRPQNECDEMTHIKLIGQSARNTFIELGKKLTKRISNYNLYRCSNWLKMNQTISNYLWI